MTHRVDRPIPGWYRRRLVKGGPWVGARIWFGPPFDPVTREPLDRSHALRCEVNGEQVDVYDAWTWLAGEPITETEFRYLEALREHAIAHEPDLPAANPRRRIDPLRTPLPF